VRPRLYSFLSDIIKNGIGLSLPYVQSGGRVVGISAREGLSATEAILVLERYY